MSLPIVNLPVVEDLLLIRKGLFHFVRFPKFEISFRKVRNIFSTLPRFSIPAEGAENTSARWTLKPRKSLKNVAYPIFQTHCHTSGHRRDSPRKLATSFDQSVNWSWNGVECICDLDCFAWFRSCYGLHLINYISKCSVLFRIDLIVLNIKICAKVRALAISFCVCVCVYSYIIWCLPCCSSARSISSTWCVKFRRYRRTDGVMNLRAKLTEEHMRIHIYSVFSCTCVDNVFLGFCTGGFLWPAVFSLF